MNQKITLYHGSEHLVETPTFGLGKKNNDFGLGFYCTESEELAKEWAVSSLRNGFANRYSLDTEYLKILNLNSPDYTILNWIAILVEHRLFSIKTPACTTATRWTRLTSISTPQRSSRTVARGWSMRRISITSSTSASTKTARSPSHA